MAIASESRHYRCLMNGPAVPLRRRRGVWVLAAFGVVLAVLGLLLTRADEPDPRSRYYGLVTGSSRASLDFASDETKTAASQVEAFCRRNAAMAAEDPDRFSTSSVVEADFIQGCTTGYADVTLCLMDGESAVACLAPVSRLPVPP